MSQSVFVIDDDDAVRNALLVLLRQQGYRARGFGGGEEFFERLPEDLTACVITDIRMPGMDGAEVVRRVMDLKDRQWRVIVMTGHADIQSAVQMMKTGVVDFVEKPFDPNRLLESVSGCLRYLEKQTSTQESIYRAQRSLETLTPRERQVFDLLVDGKTNKEIALELDISHRTVEVFRANVMAKLEAENLSTLIRTGMLAAMANG